MPWSQQRLAFIDQYIQNLRQHRAIAIDVGDQDNLKIDTSKLHDVLTNYGITHDFEVYSGAHTSHFAVRLQENVMAVFQPNVVIRIGETLTHARHLDSRQPTEGA